MCAEPAPIEQRPVDHRQIPFLNECYTYTASDATDTTMVWGSQIDMTGMRQFLAERGAAGNVLITPPAILARAVGLALAQHPEANARLLGSRTYRFTEQNVLMPVLAKFGPTLALLRRVDELSYERIAESLREMALEARDQSSESSASARFAKQLPDFLRPWGVRTLLWISNRIRRPLRPFSQHLNGAPVLINYFGFPCAPPLLAYKPSRFGSRAVLLNVTLGPATAMPVVVDNEIVIRPMAGLFVRGDHRTMDGKQLSSFVKTIAGILEHPADHDRLGTPSGQPAVV